MREVIVCIPKICLERRNQKKCGKLDFTVDVVKMALGDLYIPRTTLGFSV